MILEEISKCEPKGIIHSDLAKELEIDRDTLRKDIDSLLKFNFVKRENKKTPYHLTKNALSNISFVRGLFLNSHFLSHVLGKEGNILFNDTIVYHYTPEKKENSKVIQNAKYEQEAYYDSKNYYLKYFEPKFDKDSEIEKILFEFINQIGAYFVFTFLISLEDNHNNKLEPPESADKEWLEGSFNKSYVQIYNKFIEKFADFNPTEQQFKVLDKYLIENKIENNLSSNKGLLLQFAFFKMYPYFYHNLCKLKGRIKEDIVLFDKNRIKDFIKFIDTTRKEP